MEMVKDLIGPVSRLTLIFTGVFPNPFLSHGE